MKVSAKQLELIRKYEEEKQERRLKDLYDRLEYVENKKRVSQEEFLLVSQEKRPRIQECINKLGYEAGVIRRKLNNS